MRRCHTSKIPFELTGFHNSSFFHHTFTMRSIPLHFNIRVNLKNVLHLATRWPPILDLSPDMLHHQQLKCPMANTLAIILHELPNTLNDQWVTICLWEVTPRCYLQFVIWPPCLTVKDIQTAGWPLDPTHSRMNTVEFLQCQLPFQTAAMQNHLLHLSCKPKHITPIQQWRTKETLNRSRHRWWRIHTKPISEYWEIQLTQGRGAEEAICPSPLRISCGPGFMSISITLTQVRRISKCSWLGRV